MHTKSFTLWGIGTCHGILGHCGNSLYVLHVLQVGFGEDLGIYRNTEDNEDCQFTKAVTSALSGIAYSEKHPWDQVSIVKLYRGRQKQTLGMCDVMCVHNNEPTELRSKSFARLNAQGSTKGFHITCVCTGEDIELS